MYGSYSVIQSWDKFDDSELEIRISATERHTRFNWNFKLPANLIASANKDISLAASLSNSVIKSNQSSLLQYNVKIITKYNMLQKAVRRFDYFRSQGKTTAILLTIVVHELDITVPELWTVSSYTPFRCHISIAIHLHSAINVKHYIGRG